jgi:pimeloyl-ACP methyl ester carboxylesterase
LRGAGESDHPQETGAYGIEKLTGDVLSVADACKAEQFAVWGFSLGGNLARYLGAWSARLRAVAVIGVPFGPAVHPALDQYITEFVEKWAPVVEAERGKKASATRGKSKIKGNIPVYMACFQAMRAWPNLEASAVNCPALLLVGTKNKDPFEWVQANLPELEAAGVQVEIIPGLTHPQELSQIDRVYPLVRAFFDKSLS